MSMLAIFVIIRAAFSMRSFYLYSSVKNTHM
jgi:hypothetical protein